MSKHTPGPWRFSDNTKWWKTNPFSVTVPKKGVHGTAVANIPARATISMEEAQANARLIAAAPDLLEALDSLARYADTCELFIKETHPGKAAALRERVTNARAAIAKATGESK